MSVTIGCFYVVLVVYLVSMSVTIGCLWCCICTMSWIAHFESVNMTILFTHGAFGLSLSLEMVSKASFSSAS